MKRIIFVILLFLLIGSVCASDFSNVTVNGVDFEIPQQYSEGDVQKGKYVYKDLRTFAILCVDDYIISNYGGYYDISDSSAEFFIDDRPAKMLTVYNKYISNNVSYLYFPVGKSVYCICFEGNEADDNISHIVKTAPASNMSSDTFYGLLNEAYKSHEDRQYLDRLMDDYSDYPSQNNKYESNSNDHLIKWYLLTHW